MDKHTLITLILLITFTTTTIPIPSLACDPHDCHPKKSPPPPPKPTPSSVPCPPPPPHKPVVPCPPPKGSGGQCPIDTLKLDACVDLLGGMVHLIIGSESVHSKCCPIIEGLVGLDAALCLCTTIRAKVLDVQLLLPVALSVLVDCGKYVPSDYQCPAY